MMGVGASVGGGSGWALVDSVLLCVVVIVCSVVAGNWERHWPYAVIRGRMQFSAVSPGSWVGSVVKR